MPNFRPSASWPLLRRRAELLDCVRKFFRERNFLEVETPLLSRDTTVERYLHPWQAAPLVNANSQNQLRWLQNSPEFHMKRLLAAGGPSIFQLGKAFRADELGRLHNPEFTMLEWYAVGQDYSQGISFLDEFLQVTVQAPAAERLSYAEAFQRTFDLDPHIAEIGQLEHSASGKISVLPEDAQTLDRDGWLNLMLAECIEPTLGQNAPTILYDYPASQAALARVRRDSVPVAERFEVYWRGVELANGYHELQDAEVLRTRNKEINQQRMSDGVPPLPEESMLIEAMRAGLPECTGTALGFDRLAMLAFNARSLAEVMAFPADRA